MINELDGSMEQQLHPLRDSSWAEIFPILSIFQDIYSDNQKTTKAHEFLKNEQIIAEIQRSSTGTKFSDNDIRSMKSERSSGKLIKKRTICEKLAEFNDPQRSLGAGISSYHQQLVHFFLLFVVLFLIHIPVMVIYNNYSFYDNEGSISLSLGNLGFS